MFLLLARAAPCASFLPQSGSRGTPQPCPRTPASSPEQPAMTIRPPSAMSSLSLLPFSYFFCSLNSLFVMLSSGNSKLHGCQLLQAFQPCRLKPDLAVHRKCSAAAAVFRWSTGAPDIPGWASPRSDPATLAPSSPVALLPLPFPASPWPPASCFPAVSNFPHS